MKILVIHNYHRSGSASGDDQVYNNETKLLEKYGCEVAKYSVRNDSFDNAGLIGKISIVVGMFWSNIHYKNLLNIIKLEKPDIVHIHTFFPLLSPSILYAAKRSGLKVVVTLHDTRFICPCATSLRDNKICNLCKDGHYLRMFRHKCFKGSSLQSLIVALIFKVHRLRKSFYEQIDKYICLNNNQIKLLCESGFDPAKMVKKYNFVEDTKCIPFEVTHNIPERYVTFYGRIGEEKGIKLLMEIWNRIDDIPLVVMGGGPLEEEFSKWAENKENVMFLGYTKHEECLSIVRQSEFVVLPSICYEGCSMVALESESLGKGIIATNLGFSKEAINDGYNGYKIALGDVDGFVRTINTLWNDKNLCSAIGKNARKDYENKYTPENNYNQLINVYNDTLRK